MYYNIYEMQVVSLLSIFSSLRMTNSRLCEDKSMCEREGERGKRGKRGRKEIACHVLKELVRSSHSSLRQSGPPFFFLMDVML